MAVSSFVFLEAFQRALQFSPSQKAVESQAMLILLEMTRDSFSFVFPLKRPLKKDRNPLKRPFKKDRNPLKRPFKKDKNPLKGPFKKDKNPLKKPLKKAFKEGSCLMANLGDILGLLALIKCRHQFTSSRILPGKKGFHCRVKDWSPDLVT